MARGGINKTLVKDARDAVLLRGDNPSIDTIRVELGNTGSKTTIHRYLKELEEEEGTRLDDTALLSDTLKQMVAKLASQLQQEAKDIVEQSSTLHKRQSDNLKNQIGELNVQVKSLSEQLESKTITLHSTEAELQDVNKQCQMESTKCIELTEKLNALDIRLTDKALHIQSLEEKHQHAREALEHFRESAKEQREQEILRHEQQIQQVQAENRRFAQSLSVKQDDITRLNKDNGRLVSQFREVQKQLDEMARVNKELDIKLNKSVQVETIASSESDRLRMQLKSVEVDAKRQQAENRIKSEKLMQELEQTNQDNRNKELEITKLQAELSTRKAIFSQLKNTKLALS